LEGEVRRAGDVGDQAPEGAGGGEPGLKEPLARQLPRHRAAQCWPIIGAVGGEEQGRRCGANPSQRACAERLRCGYRRLREMARRRGVVLNLKKVWRLLS